MWILPARKFIPEGRMDVREIGDSVILPLHEQVHRAELRRHLLVSVNQIPLGSLALGRSQSVRGLSPFRQMNLVPCALGERNRRRCWSTTSCQVPPANSSRSSFAMAAWAEKLPRLPSVAAPAPDERGIAQEAAATDGVFEVDCHGFLLLWRINSIQVIALSNSPPFKLVRVTPIGRFDGVPRCRLLRARTILASSGRSVNDQADSHDSRGRTVS